VLRAFFLCVAEGCERLLGVFIKIKKVTQGQ